MNDPTGLPKLIERFTDVPERDRHIYEREKDGYKLTAGGRQLRKVRQIVAEHHSIEHAPPLVWGEAPAEVALPDWQRTIAAASVSERKALLQLAAAGRVAIKR